MDYVLIVFNHEKSWLYSMIDGHSQVNDYQNKGS